MTLKRRAVARAALMRLPLRLPFAAFHYCRHAISSLPPIRLLTRASARAQSPLPPPPITPPRYFRRFHYLFSRHADYFRLMLSPRRRITPAFSSVPPPILAAAR